MKKFLKKTGNEVKNLLLNCVALPLLFFGRFVSAQINRPPCRRLLTVLILALIFPVSFADDSRLAPRRLHSKSTRTVLGPMDDPRIVIFKLKESASFSRGRRRRAPSAGQNRSAYRSLVSGQRDSLSRVFRSFGIRESAVQPLFDIPAGEAAYMDERRRQGQRQSGRELADLSLYHQVEVPEGVNSARFCDELNALPFVETALPSIKPAPLPFQSAPPLQEDVPPEEPKTPDFTPLQFQLNSPELGIEAVRHLPGADGGGVSIVDVELAWYLDHEDIERSRVSNIDSETAGLYYDNDYSRNHGTAILGILGAQKNDYGVTGLSPGAKLYIAPAPFTHRGFNPARIIDIATRRLAPGDIILIEMQTWVCNGRYGPLELYPPIFDVVSSAVSAGITVVAAAGNGGVNLDDPSCEGLFDRNVRDSGAIIVGAGDPETLRRLPFSSYGSRVDAQGYGQNVVTTGFGDLFGEGDRRRSYTDRMGGTSSAAAVVAGAVAVLQGIVKADGRPPLKPKQVRRLLYRTGSWPDGGERESAIGPLPNLASAVSALGFEVLHKAIVPLFFSAETAGFKSFVRLSNPSKQDGSVLISAFDWEGRLFGPFSVFLKAGQTVSFSSQDLQEEMGDGGVGNYRLTLTSLLNFESAAYVWFPDGSYNDMNETVSSLRFASGRVFPVNIFEPPETSRTRKSFLYFANPADRPARIEIDTVTDDSGSPVFEGSVAFSIPQRSSLLLSAGDIQKLYEEGGDSFSVTDSEKVNFADSFELYRFGVETPLQRKSRKLSNRISIRAENNTEGIVQPSKWQLVVSSDAPVHIMNLMFDLGSRRLFNLSR